MRIMRLSEVFSVSAQIQPDDLESLREQGVLTLVGNRPDGESEGQVAVSDLAERAASLGMTMVHLPFKSGEQTREQVAQLAEILDRADEQGERVHAYCRTGNRSTCLWAAARVRAGENPSTVLSSAKEIGFDVVEAIKSINGEKGVPSPSSKQEGKAKPSFDVVIVGAGSGGIALASSLLKRRSSLRIALVDPAESHYYQPGWTMVGGGVFGAAQTRRKTRDLIPRNVSWLKQSVVGFSPQENTVQLDNEQSIHYKQLVVSPGLTLDWEGVKGLKEGLGQNGVTSNYSYQHAPYTWELVKNLKKGRALFTQPPMPIKCAGAPQKALYLSGDHWHRSGVLKNIQIDFFNAGGVLFGVPDYVPALQAYIDKYKVATHYNHSLVEVDGDKKCAYFKSNDPDKAGEVISEDFDILHVCPPQKAPEFVAASELSDESGWLDVDQFSLRHRAFENIWGLGDVMNTPNAKTMAAVRKQVPVVADNLVSSIENRAIAAGYDGYGSCPLTVERGKIVLAEFGYGGKLLPTFPRFILNGTEATRAAWILKKDILPAIYWHGMLKGREWLASPVRLESH